MPLLLLLSRNRRWSEQAAGLQGGGDAKSLLSSEAAKDGGRGVAPDPARLSRPALLSSSLALNSTSVAAAAAGAEKAMGETYTVS